VVVLFLVFQGYRCMHGRRSRGGILFPYNDHINQVGRLARTAERARLNQRHTLTMEDERDNPPINPPPPMNPPPYEQPPQMDIHPR
jgi:Asp-tRNA(Asn)/Glu-tRNA(Gln) amidotransferase A subunit family amidase